MKRLFSDISFLIRKSGNPLYYIVKLLEILVFTVALTYLGISFLFVLFQSLF